MTASWPARRALARSSLSRNSIAVVLLVVGAAVMLLGLAVWSGALSWFGRLPGDVRVERPGLRVYVPITSMILLSIVLSLVLAIARRLR